MIVSMSSLFLLGLWSNVQSNANDVLQAPSWNHWMGTDNLGRDLMIRLFEGAQVSLMVAVGCAILSVSIGLLYGGIAGLAGGWIDRLMMKGIEVVLSIPQVALLILISVFVQELPVLVGSTWRGLIGLSVGLVAVGWLETARVVRQQLRQIKQEPFIEAARAVGASPWRLLRFHLLPSVAGSVLVLLVFHIPANILYESFLSFIGLGIQPPRASWGLLVAEGWSSLRYHPHLILFPSLLLVLTTGLLHVLGETLSDSIHRRT